MSCAVHFGEPVGRVKIQTKSKNSQQYYTTKRLIRDSDYLTRQIGMFVRANFVDIIYLQGECAIEVCETERNWRGKSS